MSIKLSICMVTMNRAEKVQKALKSCLRCIFPFDVEYIVIDNGSTDNTQEYVKTVFKSSERLIYKKLDKNVGAGMGRNIGYELAKGEYFYCLDDDAYIPEDSDDFFIRAVDILDRNSDIVALATQIYDLSWRSNRIELGKKTIKQQSGYKKSEDDNLFACKMFCGGSHFLRKAFYGNKPYYENYRYEELPPSLYAYEKKKLCVVADNLVVIHDPPYNKSNHLDEKNYEIMINNCSVQYAIRKMMYPSIFLPILWLATSVRKYKYLRKIPNINKAFAEDLRKNLKKFPIKYKIKFVTVIQMFIKFGFSIF